jgi:hypothetical protein
MASIPCRNVSPTSPYRTAERPPPETQSLVPLDVAGMAAFLWVVTVGRVALGAAHAEPPGRELALAWLVLVSLPVLAGWALARDRRGG